MELRRLWIFAIVAFAVLVVIASVRQPSASASSDEPAPSGNGKRVPVIVELFTSEGCSSCPPADALLRRLEETQPVPGAEIIVLGNHVDYWNYIGWTDRFSSKSFSQRQSEYGDAFGLDSVYTPQMVVDGKAEFNGADESRAKKAIIAAAREAKANVSLVAADGSDANVVPLKIQIDSIPVSSKNAIVLVALTEGHLETNVRNGENGGRTLKHTGVVRELRQIGAAVSGSSFAAEPKIKLDPEWKRSGLRAVVFVQESQSKRILGAGSILLAKK